jgi:threonine-phosphate decarboxylase
MNQPIHGGGVDLAMRELGLRRDQICDFSASINPLGMPAEALQALQAALARINDYPELDAASLRAELARFHRLPEAHLLPGSGSTELIYLLPRVLRPRRALLLRPCFSEYAPALGQVGCAVDYLDLRPERHFAFSVADVLQALRPDTELVLLANPGNPSGIAIDPQLLLDLAGRLGPCRLLVDEAFVDFCPQHSLLAQVPAQARLLVLRSLTKFYAIPGLRAGYLAGPAEDIARLAAGREPWTLSTLAIAAAKACLTAAEFRTRTLERLPQLRGEFKRQLELLGFQVFPGAANYLLGRLPEEFPEAAEISRRLRVQGLLVRGCADFAPLDGRYLRLAVLGEAQNRRLLQALGGLAGEPGP